MMAACQCDLWGGATWALWCEPRAHPDVMKGCCYNFISWPFQHPRGLLVSLRLPTGPVHSDWRRCRHDFLCLITICSPVQVPNSKLFIVWSRPSAPNTDQRLAHHDDWPEIETYRASDGLFHMQFHLNLVGNKANLTWNMTARRFKK